MIADARDGSLQHWVESKQLRFLRIQALQLWKLRDQFFLDAARKRLLRLYRCISELPIFLAQNFVRSLLEGLRSLGWDFVRLVAKEFISRISDSIARQLRD
jgi:hypothetical protein